MEDALISVIVPVYNVASYLHRCLDSIANQTYRNLEIILVDDGSSDGSSRICDEFAAKEPRAMVIHQQNKGLWAARNAGQDAANGEFLFFPDSDDYFHYDMLRLMYEAITSGKGYDVAIVNRKKTSRNDEDCCSTVDCKWEEWTSEHAVTQVVNSRDPYTNVWNKLYRTSSIMGIRARPYPVAQDLDFNIRAFMHIKAICTEQVLYYWYSHSGQISKKHSIIGFCQTSFIKTM